MVIGFDLRPLQGLHRFRGIGVYTRNLVTALSRIDHQNEYVFFAFKSDRNPLADLQIDKKFQYKIVYVSSLIKNETIYRFLFSWRTYAPISTDTLDVFFQPDVAFGLAPHDVPTNVVFYDIIPTLFHEHHLDRTFRQVLISEGLKSALGYIMNRRIYSASLARIKKAARVTAISESSKKDLAGLKLVGEKEIIVAQLGATNNYHTYTAAEIAPVLHKLKINRPYLLYLGGGDYRKNVIDAIKVHSSLKVNNKNLSLVLVGRDFEDQQRGDNIVSVGFGADEDLPLLYAGAAAFVFPSKYEGFGFPVLEAMRCGTPVIAYNNSSIPEIVGKSFNLASDQHQFIEIAKKIFSDNEYKKASIQKALKVSQKFTWELTAQKTLDSIARTRS